MASVFITMIIILAMVVIVEFIVNAGETAIVVTLVVFSVLMIVLMWIWPPCDRE